MSAVWWPPWQMISSNLCSSVSYTTTKEKKNAITRSPQLYLTRVSLYLFPLKLFLSKSRLEINDVPTAQELRATTTKKTAPILTRRWQPGERKNIIHWCTMAVACRVEFYLVEKKKRDESSRRPAQENESQRRRKFLTNIFPSIS